MKKNAFNQVIPKIKELFGDSKVSSSIEKTLISVLKYLEINNPEQIVKDVLTEARNYKRLEDYETKINSLMDKKRVLNGIPIKLGDRAKVMFNQVKEYVRGHQVLDLGCGDGKVGEKISKQGRQVILADVYKNGNISNLDLPFVKISKRGILPFDSNIFDTVLLLTVLHHSDNPKFVIDEAVRVAKKGGKIIVIESVYGVFGKERGLNNEQQRMFNIFFDHFYNRVIHYSSHKENKVNVPFNFQTPKKWKEFFENNGLKQEKVEMLGFDQPVVPEYHTLHVLAVKK